jgi:hypothetical protein
MTNSIALKELPPKDAPDYFRLLVRNCIETYKKLPNDVMCLDYNRVSGKLRAMVLDDDEYKQETRNIYAKQRIEELDEIDQLAQNIVTNDEDEDDPRSRMRKKKVGNVDKDMLTMRFKAAQMKREIIASLNAADNASERDAVNMLFITVTKEEFEQNVRHELYDGDEDGELNELTEHKEAIPEGTNGKMRLVGSTKPAPDDASFEVLDNGAIIER